MLTILFLRMLNEVGNLANTNFTRFQKQKNQMKKQKPDTRMGYDFEDAKTQRKTRSSLKSQLHSKERMLVKKQLRSAINWNTTVEGGS